MVRLLPLLLIACVAVGCGGEGHVAARESYTGAYVLSSGKAGGAVVLDVVGSEAEGSVAVGGAVYDFEGRLGADGELAAAGSGVVVHARLTPVLKGLGGPLSLSGAVALDGAQASLSRADGPE